MKKILKVLVVIGAVLIVAYIGLTVWATFHHDDPVTASEIQFPKVEAAKYQVVIKNTGNVLFTSKYDTYGKTFVLHGYWEKSGMDFVYRKQDYPIDQNVFGPVEIKERVK